MSIASLTTPEQEQLAGIGLGDVSVWAKDEPASKLMPTAVTIVGK